MSEAWDKYQALHEAVLRARQLSAPQELGQELESLYVERLQEQWLAMTEYERALAEYLPKSYDEEKKP